MIAVIGQSRIACVWKVDIEIVIRLVLEVWKLVEWRERWPEVDELWLLIFEAVEVWMFGDCEVC